MSRIKFQVSLVPALLFIIIYLGFRFKSSETPHLEANANKLNLSTQCGQQVLTAANGTISYKFNSEFGKHEPCVWIVRVVNASHYTVRVTGLGFPHPDVNHRLGVMSFSYGDVNDVSLITSGATYTFNPAYILVISFQTGSNAKGNTGFSLEYTAHFTGDLVRVGLDSKDYFLPGDSVEYPPDTYKYFTEEQTTLVFLPEYNTEEDYTAVTVEVTNIEDNCRDSVTVYSMSSNPSIYAGMKPWNYRARICSTNGTTRVESRDVLLVHYESDGYYDMYSGFNYYSFLLQTSR